MILRCFNQTTVSTDNKIDKREIVCYLYINIANEY